MSSFWLRLLLVHVCISLINCAQMMTPLPPSRRSQPRCASLVAPMEGKGCTIQNHAYVINKQLKIHPTFTEYWASPMPTARPMGAGGSNKRWVVLEWYSLQQESTKNATKAINIVVERLRSKFNITCNSNLLLKWKQSHFIEYNEQSISEQGDKSLILVRKFYSGGNIMEFNKNILWKLKHLSKWFKEVFAIHSWCDFLRQLSKSLKSVNLTRVDLNDIFVDTLLIPSDDDGKEMEHYKYVLGRLERQNFEEQMDEHEIISLLAMAAWEYYSMFAETGIIVDGNGNKLIERRSKDINHFAMQSKLYWNTFVSLFDEKSASSNSHSTKSKSELEMEGRDSSDEAEKVLMMGIIPDPKNLQFWQDSMEREVATFTSQFALTSKAGAGFKQDWYQFDMQWNRICHDWIYQDLDSNATISALEKYELLTDKPRDKLSDITKTTQFSSPSLSTPISLCTPNMQSPNMNFPSDPAKSSLKSSLKSGSSKSRKRMPSLLTHKGRDTVIHYIATDDVDDNDVVNGTLNTDTSDESGNPDTVNHDNDDIELHL